MYSRYILITILLYLLSTIFALPTNLVERKQYVAVALTYTIKEPNGPVYTEPAPAEAS